MNARPSPPPAVERDDRVPTPSPGRAQNGSAARTGPNPAPSPRQSMRAPRRMGGTARRRAVVYDDQARRFGRKGPAPSPVEVRRVRRILRRVDPWSLFRFAFVLYSCVLLVFMAAVVALWLVASSAGAIPSIEHFITQLFALKKFQFKSRQLFFATLAIGVIGVGAATLFTVISAVLYNLISDIVGGIELTVLEEQPLDTVN